MPSLLKALQSQVGRKVLTSVTGIGLMIFIVGHLVGNLTLFGSAQAFNEYTLGLEQSGWILYFIEFILAVGFLLHAFVGISIWWKRRQSRPQGYEEYHSKGGPSHLTWSSRTMIITGVVLFVFLIIHLDSFKFGDTETIMLNGEQARDLKALVIEKFQTPWYAFGYTFVMILLGFHLGHGFWSSFTSLTMRHNKLSGIVYTVGIVFAILMAIGFIFIPLYIYFTSGQGALIAQ